MDVTVSGVFKSYFTEDYKTYVAAAGNATFEAKFRTFCLQLAQRSLISAATPRNCKLAFIQTGLFPLNSKIPLSSALITKSLPVQVFDIIPANRRDRLTDGMYMVDFSDEDDDDYIPNLSV